MPQRTTKPSNFSREPSGGRERGILRDQRTGGARAARESAIGAHRARPHILILEGARSLAGAALLPFPLLLDSLLRGRQKAQELMGDLPVNYGGFAGARVSGHVTGEGSRPSGEDPTGEGALGAGWN